MSTQTPEKTIIEINGVKLEVDLRTAKRIENITVGSRVKVLKKKYSDYEVLHGIVIGFEPFKELPTIIIAALTISYSEAKIDFIYYNAKSEGMEVCVALDADSAAVDKNQFLAFIEREVAKKESEIMELNSRKKYFLDKFGCYFGNVDAPQS